MYFLLGVLLATLVALLVLPAVWHRAVRLTTRRVEAAVPVSLFEIQADKDQQRAFFALNQRRLELQLEDMRGTIVHHAATIETQRQRIAELEGQVAELGQAGDKAHAVAAERQVLTGELEDQVSTLKAQIARLEEELGGTRGTLAQLEAAHKALEVKAKVQVETLAARDASLHQTEERHAALGAEAALLTTNLTTTSHRLDATSDLLEKERAQVARLNGELAEVSASLASREESFTTQAAELDDRTQERDRLAAELSTIKADLEASRSVIHAFEHRRASEFAEAEAEARRMNSTVDMLRADHALMSDALSKARGETGAAGESEADVLPVKEALAEVAAQIVALTARMEGAGSPIPALLAQTPKSAADAPEGGPVSLAERIQALLDAPQQGQVGNGAVPHPAETPAPAAAVEPAPEVAAEPQAAAAK